jgi:hypothetical protein
MQLRSASPLVVLALVAASIVACQSREPAAAPTAPRGGTPEPPATTTAGPRFVFDTGWMYPGSRLAVTVSRPPNRAMIGADLSTSDARVAFFSADQYPTHMLTLVAPGRVRLSASVLGVAVDSTITVEPLPAAYPDLRIVRAEVRGVSVSPDEAGAYLAFDVALPEGAAPIRLLGVMLDGVQLPATRRCGGVPLPLAAGERTHIGALGFSVDFNGPLTPPAPVRLRVLVQDPSGMVRLVETSASAAPDMGGVIPANETSGWSCR